ncbi:MAG: anaerobic ribonucleoside-triphosphate reductase activating protein [Candidatus Cloacimonetes bacterium]|nr:anaerobic ribonucleoside-triphosphate reductase activating protein [Candidatus Cloacimonadota bacterium]
MNIFSVRQLSTVDYPGQVASVIYFGGCNLRCPFCHNEDLVLPDRLASLPRLSVEEALSQVVAASKLTSAVVLSGGEPTLAGTSLISFAERLRGLGKLVKLDTNGLAPFIIDELSSAGLIDYLALDAKTSPHRYSTELAGASVSEEAFQSTLTSLRKRTRVTTVEVRTTCVPGLVSLEDIHVLGPLVAEAGDTWVLQQFVPRFCMDPAYREKVPYSLEELQLLASTARQYVPKVQLRGV